MAQRRVAASGFGGAGPGLRILQGVAQGRLDREKRNQEQQRQAILNRLSKSQMNQIKQNMRLKREENDRLDAERQREQAASEAAVTNLKNYFMEQGMSAEEAENRATAMVSGQTTVADVEKAEANLEQVRSSTRANETSIAATNEELARLRRQNRLDTIATEALGDPRIVAVANNESASPSARTDIIRRRIRENNPDLGDEEVDQATAKVMDMTRGTPGAQPFDASDDQVRAWANDLIAKTGGVDKAVATINQEMKSNPNLRELGKRMIDEIVDAQSMSSGLQGDIQAEAQEQGLQ